MFLDSVKPFGDAKRPAAQSATDLSQVSDSDGADSSDLLSNRKKDDISVCRAEIILALR